MFFRTIIRKVIPSSIRARYYSLMDRLGTIKSSFWKVSRQEFPTFYYFFQTLVTRIYLRWLRLKSPDAYQRLVHADLPERLLRTIIFRLAFVKTWKKFPVLPNPPDIKTDVLFVSYSAHPDLVKMCIALKRSRPGIRCTLIASRHAHTQGLCKQWFDEVIITGKGNDLAILSATHNAQAKVVVMRFREIVFHILTRLYCQAPLIYYPPGFFLSSRSVNFLSDPELSLDEVLKLTNICLNTSRELCIFYQMTPLTGSKKKE